VTPHLQVILWEDLFVVVDDGRADATDYPRLGDLVEAQCKRYPRGVGALTIVPAHARPLTPEARRAIGELLARPVISVRCASWVVEGRGFEGAMVRAVLTGIQVFGRYPYKIHISNELDEALGWMLAQLAGSAARQGTVATAARFIRSQRAREAPEHSSG
jgi:hypothetical protein